MATELVIATGNPDKLAEWIALLEGSAWLPVPYEGPSPDEIAQTYEGNAALKALAAAQRTGLPALGDDTGVAVDALDGAPGLFTRRWAEERGGFETARVELAALASGSRAIYRCGLAFAEPSGSIVAVLGEVEGRIAASDGPGAGFEPCFVPEGADRSLATLSDARRAALHHRARAWARLQAAISG